jgi:type II secretion system protein H
MRATSAIGERGFTLLELMVVLAIIVLMAAAWPIASAQIFGAQRLRDEAQQLAGAVRLGQMTARITGVQEELRISPDGTTYSIVTDEHHLPHGMTLHLRAQSEDASARPLILFPDGSSTGAVLNLSLRDRVAVLQILRMTGRLEVSE